MIRVLTVLILLTQPAVAAPLLGSTCQPQRLYTLARPHSLVITEVALTREYHSCPTVSDDVGRNIEFDVGDTIYAWFRIQGRADYVRAKGGATISVRAFRVDDLESGDPPDFSISNGKIDVLRASREARDFWKNGSFDWRFDANKTRFDVPGDYVLEIAYGGQKVCYIDGTCTLEFKVKERAP